MVLDPLSSVALAASVVQFIQFGSQILSNGNELYKSIDGTLKENSFLELLVYDLQKLLARIEHSAVCSLPGFDHFQSESLGLAKELLEALQKLKLSGTKTPRKALFKALKSVCSKKKISEWLEKLNLLRQHFSFEIEAAILTNISLIDVPLSEGFKALEEEQRRLIQKFCETLQNIDGEIFSAKVVEQARIVAEANALEHLETRCLIDFTGEKILDFGKQDGEATRRLMTEQHEAILQKEEEHGTTLKVIASRANEAISLNEAEEQKSRDLIIASVKDETNTARQSIERIVDQEIDQVEMEAFRSQIQKEQHLALTYRSTQAIVEHSRQLETTEIRTELRTCLDQIKLLHLAAVDKQVHGPSLGKSQPNHQNVVMDSTSSNLDSTVRLTTMKEDVACESVIVNQPGRLIKSAMEDHYCLRCCSCGTDNAPDSSTICTACSYCGHVKCTGCVPLKTKWASEFLSTTADHSPHRSSPSRRFTRQAREESHRDLVMQRVPYFDLDANVLKHWLLRKYSISELVDFHIENGAYVFFVPYPLSVEDRNVHIAGLRRRTEGESSRTWVWDETKSTFKVTKTELRCDFPGCSSKPSFRRESELRRHYRQHEPSRYHCEVPGCDREFARLYHYHSHLNAIHSKDNSVGGKYRSPGISS